MAGVGREATQFKSEGLNIGSKRPFSFKVPDKYDEILLSLPNRSAKIRQWVIEGMIREGLIEE